MSWYSDAIGTATDIATDFVPGGGFIDTGIDLVTGIFDGGPSDAGQFEGLPLNELIDAGGESAKQRIRRAWARVSPPKQVSALDGFGRPQTDIGGYSSVLKAGLAYALQLHASGNPSGTAFLRAIAGLASDVGSGGVARTIRATMKGATEAAQAPITTMPVPTMPVAPEPTQPAGGSAPVAPVAAAPAGGGVLSDLPDWALPAAAVLVAGGAIYLTSRS